ncbi:thiamine-phosphate kinase [Candidatus Sumerlaeota bacterium]|nr:thiamine-phosphate kinase [Candidatus Sumerlaeota bacterium]
MKIADLGEKKIIESIAPFTGINRYVEVGFGDDGAVLRIDKKNPRCVVTTDILVEGTHFLFDRIGFKNLGYKSYEVNASDIAAMGAWPVAAFLSLGLKSGMEYRSLKDFYKGFSLAAKRHGCLILGGDTVRADRLFISITLVGVYEKGSTPLRRSAAKSGDRIYITGWPGESGMGFILLKDRKPGVSTLAKHPLIARHIRPTSRVNVGTALARSPHTGAVIDVSDGVYNELNLLSQSSGKKMKVYLHKLPISQRLHKEATARHLDSLQMALFGGEDYELLFTSSLRLPRVKKLFDRKGARCPLHEIGIVEQGGGVVFLNDMGERVTVIDKTFEHFPDERP